MAEAEIYGKGVEKGHAVNLFLEAKNVNEQQNSNLIKMGPGEGLSLKNWSFTCLWQCPTTKNIKI